MRNLRIPFTRLLIALAAVALLLPTGAAWAQHGHDHGQDDDRRTARRGDDRGVRIVVWEVDTRDELLQLHPGDTLTLEEDQHVLLRIINPAVESPTGERRYLEAEWDIVGQAHGVELSDPDRDRGLVKVHAFDDQRTRRATTNLRFRLLDPPEGQPDRGMLHLKVAEIAEHDHDGDDDEIAGDLLPPAESLTAMLYRGILLREPNEGADVWTERIEERGFDGLVSAARDIASSDESLSGIYGRGVDNEERLEALYEHLLERDPDDVSRAVWERQLALLDARRVEDVVAALVTSPDFRGRYANEFAPRLSLRR